MKIIAMAVVGFTMLSFGAESLRAANGTWTGGGSDSNWSDASNWTPGVPGATNGATNGTNTDSAIFSSAVSNNTVTIDKAGQDIGSILIFGNAASTTIGSNSGNPLYLATTSIIVGNIGTFNGVTTSALTGSNLVETIAAPIIIQNPNGNTQSPNFQILNNSVTFASSVSGTGGGSAVINITGSIYGAKITGFNPTYTVNLKTNNGNNNINTVSGLATNNGGFGGNGILAFTINGSTWDFTNNGNSFTGQVQVFGGTLMASSMNTNSGVGTSAIGVGGAGTTAVTINGTNTFVSNNTIVLGAGGGTGTFDYTGNTASSDRSFLLNNNATGGGGTIQVGTADQTLNLSGAITTSLTSSSSTLNLTGPGNGVLSGGISNAGTLGINVNSGKWTFSGSNSFTNGGNTLVKNAGTVLAVNANLVSGGAVGVSAGATLMGNGNISAASGVQMAGGANLQAGADSTTTGTSLTFASGTRLTTSVGTSLTFVLAADHSDTTLALDSGSTNTLANGLSFNFLGTSAVGTYNDLITGLASDPGNESTWVINTAGDVGTFSYSDGDISLILTAASVPEPSTWAMLFGGFGLLLVMRHRRQSQNVG